MIWLQIAVGALAIGLVISGVRTSRLARRVTALERKLSEATRRFARGGPVPRLPDPYRRGDR